MSSRKLAIESLSVTSLRPDPKNARIHSGKQVQQIARSIEDFGFNVPVLVDAQLRVIAGHGRLRACEVLGITEVPTIKLEHLSEHQVRAFMIADNRLTENAQWDDQLLGEQLKILSEAEIDFTLEATGFEMGEIDVFIENLSPATAGQSDPADAVAEPSTMQVSQPDDLWELGKNRLLCGNALVANNYEKLLGNQKAEMVFTDPPYNVPIAGHASGNGQHRHRNFVMGVGEMNHAEFTKFLTDALRLLASFSIDKSLHYICMDWRHLGELLTAGTAVYSDLKNLCVWVKDNAGMGSFYRSQHELIFVFQNAKSAHRNNIQLGRFGRSRSNVWNYPSVNSFGAAADEGDLLALHPTVKPVALIADAIKDCTARGDLVLDPFLGSGTSIIAAERTGRVCYGMDLDPMYVDTTIRRWQRFTHLQAVHQASGQNFHQREQEVAHGGK
jgi:DNA modification methylase